DNRTHQPLLGDERSDADRHDGRLYLDEIPQIIDATGTVLGLFDVVGKLAAELQIRLYVALVFDKTFTFDWTLAEFESNFTNDLPPGGPDLANLLPNGGSNKKLVLTSTTDTSNAFRHGRAGTDHPGGDNVQILYVDKNQNPDDGPAVLGFSDASATISGTDLQNFTLTKTGFGFADKGVAVGQRVHFLVNLNGGGLGQKAGTVTAVTNDAVTIKLDQPLDPNLEEIIPDGQYAFLSGRETLRARKLGVTEDFGPQEPAPNFISDVAFINLITDQGP